MRRDHAISPCLRDRDSAVRYPETSGKSTSVGSHSWPWHCTVDRWSRFGTGPSTARCQKRIRAREREYVPLPIRTKKRVLFCPVFLSARPFRFPQKQALTRGCEGMQHKRGVVSDEETAHADGTGGLGGSTPIGSYAIAMLCPVGRAAVLRAPYAMSSTDVGSAASCYALPMRCPVLTELCCYQDVVHRMRDKLKRRSAITWIRSAPTRTSLAARVSS
eukprot:3403168-Rhodomonas_salina.5